MAEPRKVEIRAYVAGDAAMVKLRPELAHEAMDPRVLRGVMPGRAWTLTVDGFVVACGGIVPEGHGRACAWLYLGEPPAVARRQLVLGCAAALGQAALALGVRRIEAHAPVAFPAAQRFLEFLGFQREGVARAWGPDGSDYVTFAKVAA